MEAIIFSPLDCCGPLDFCGKVAHVPSFLHTLIVAGFVRSPSTFPSTLCWQSASHGSKVKRGIIDFFTKFQLTLTTIDKLVVEVGIV